jgi:heat shock protein HtpX
MIGAGSLLFFAPTIVVLLQLAVSRTREFNADQGAAELTHDPMGLASALQKLERVSGGNRGILDRILKPGQKRAQPAMLRTHPPTDERIEKLAELVEHQPAQQEIEYIEPSSRRRVPVSIKPKVKRPARYHWASGLWH